VKRAVIIGLGNPVLTDDGVGIRVARQLDQQLGDTDMVDVKEAYAGGLRLLDAITGYDRATIVDAMRTQENVPGRIHRLTRENVHTTWNSVSVHDMSLTTALEMGALLELPLPTQIDIWGIEGADLDSFGETLTPEVSRAVPLVVDTIARETIRWVESAHSDGA
jgi:hydrogenase maturation protease